MRLIAISPLIASTLLFSACSTTPPDSLQMARTEFSQINSNPAVATHAPEDLQQASEALRRAENAWEDDEDDEVVNHLAYLSTSHARIAQERARTREAEQQIENATAERDRVRLEARTVEADRAKMQAAQAQQQARDARTVAALAQANSRDVQARNAELEAQLKALRGKSTDRGTVITLGDVLFDTGKSRLKPGSRRNMEQLATALKNTGGRKVLIEGHTDSKGSDELNQQLSEARANAVREALIGLGVDQAQISTAGYGERYPIASNNTAAGRQLNRRVEIVIGRDEQTIEPRSNEGSGSSSP